jgi:hypothetical protein
MTTCSRTPGPSLARTPAHQRFRCWSTARASEGRGDAAHFHENYDNNDVPSVNYDRAETIASPERLKQIQKNLNATVIIPDPRDIDKLAAFPAGAE